MDNEDLIGLIEEIQVQDELARTLDIVREILLAVGDENYLGMDEFIKMVA
jgi:hypothetical protein